MFIDDAMRAADTAAYVNELLASEEGTPVDDAALLGFIERTARGLRDDPFPAIADSGAADVALTMRTLGIKDNGSVEVRALGVTKAPLPLKR